MSQVRSHFRGAAGSGSVRACVHVCACACALISSLFSIVSAVHDQPGVAARPRGVPGGPLRARRVALRQRHVARLRLRREVSARACVRVCVFVCVRVCTYVCMYVCVCMYEVDLTSFHYGRITR